MLKDNKNLWFISILTFVFLTLLGVKTLGHAQDYRLIARSKPLFQFDLLPVTRWIDLKPIVLARSIGFPQPDVYAFDPANNMLYSFFVKDSDSLLAWEFIMRDSLGAPLFLAGDYDADGQVELITTSSTYFGDGEELVKLDYNNGRWTKTKAQVPYFPGLGFSGKFFRANRDDFVFTFSMDTIAICDTCYYDIEYPPVGLVFCEWEKESLITYPDSTPHYWIQAVASRYGQPTFVYIAEEYQPMPGGKPFGAVVKYMFDRTTRRLTALYATYIPEFPYGIFNDNSSRLFISDTLITLMAGNVIQRFVDSGDSLRTLGVEHLEFDCYDSDYLDIDKDGTVELICSEPVVKGKVGRDPNWIIKVYDIIE